MNLETQQVGAARSPSSRASGFTLIELMVVVTILGLLAIALLPQIGGITNQGAAADTSARIQLLRAMIRKYADTTGELPPSDFAMALKGVSCKSDATNSGIECLLIHLHQKSLGPNFSLDDHEDWLKNTDKDDNGFLIPTLNTTKKLEVVDAWNNPIAYFNNLSYLKPQEIVMGDEDEGEGRTESVSANKGERGYLNRTKFQLISAGPDGVFNTEDDVAYPQPVAK